MRHIVQKAVECYVEDFTMFGRILFLKQPKSREP